MDISPSVGIAAALLARDRAQSATPGSPSFDDVLRDARSSDDRANRAVGVSPRERTVETGAHVGGAPTRPLINGGGANTHGIQVTTPDAASPDRMFDAAKPEAHARRREELEARSRNDIEQAAADRRERRVGVTTRHERVDVDEIGAAARGQNDIAANELPGPVDHEGDSGGGFAASNGPTQAALPAVEPPSSVGAADTVTQTRRDAVRAEQNSSRSNLRMEPVPMARSGGAPSNAQRHAVSPPAPGIATGPETGVARDLGQWLASRGAADAMAPSALNAAPGSGENGGAPSSDTTAASAKQTRIAEKGAAPESTEKPASFADIVRSLRMGGGERFSSASIRLNPPELGRMFVSVRMADGQVRVAVRTETEAALAVVRRGAEELRASLRSLGFDVDAFDVRVESHTDHGAAERVASMVGQEGRPSSVTERPRHERARGGATTEPEARAEGGMSPRGISERRRRDGLDVSV